MIHHPFRLLALVLVVAILAGCGGATLRPTTPQPPVTGEVTPGVGSGVDAVGWYNPCFGSGCFGPENDRLWEELRRSSNTLMLRDRLGEWQQVLLRNPKAAGFVEAFIAVIDPAMAGPIAKAARAAGLKVCYCNPDDEIDLDGGYTTAQANAKYRAAKASLAAHGCGDVKVAANWAAAPGGNWRRFFAGPERLEMDFWMADGWYTGGKNQVHSAVPRVTELYDFLEANGYAGMDIVNVIQVFSAPPPLNETEIDGEWVTQQLLACCGGGPARYVWTNLATGDRADVVTMIDPKYQARTKMVLAYLMDHTRDTDKTKMGGNCPDCVDALAAWAKPRGLTAAK